jgi:hypothetical protein
MIHFLRRLLICLVLILFALEATLYMADIPKDYQSAKKPPQFQDSLDPEIGYTSIRSTSIDFTYDRNPRGYFREGSIVQHQTNAAGFRGPEISVTKPPNTQRVIFLGDSITFGEGVYFEDTYPEQFEKLGNEQHLFEQNIEALNLGVGGYNTQQEYNLLKYVAELTPDRIVVGYNMNDASEPIFKVENGAFTRTPSELESFTVSVREAPPLFQFSRIARVIRSWYTSRLITQKTLAYYHNLYADDHPSWLETKEAIRLFGIYQQETGIPITFIIFPRLFQLDQYPFVAERERVIAVLKENGLDYLLVSPRLTQYRGPELWVHPTDQHPNEIVHRIVAEQLVKKFSDQARP